ncbi:MAG: tyrosine-type recombinase/integrase [Brevundimonas sp.]|uniref:Tyrosine-type recombinase/integrase n=1 Tax=Brevundimonas albigilva TaxID=1312364 RepID=A0ABY4SJW1_9CAUL|nr:MULTISPECIES: tyrosine-type recombinase/integrase [Brevundimonas]MCV0416511.1 tyrosine-type recombinase/integrase [Brevundimonas sp.]URI14987.1 tyrosine-type recombinase/integrase [Brevundimonas albigilva]
MGRPAKGARLYLRQGRIDGRTGRTLAAVYFIRDGAKNISTGCGPERLTEAEVALAEYLTAKAASVRPKDRALEPEEVLIDEVVALYAREKAPGLADPSAVSARLGAILDWWSGMTLGDVRRSTCMAYVAHRTAQPIKAFKNAAQARRVSPAGARRELEDLSAATSYWDAEHRLTRKPVFTYPKTAAGPRDALSREQVAAILRAARGWRLTPEGWRATPVSTRSNRAHLVRFVLLGIYTGTRPGVLPKLRWTPSDDSAWVDLEKGWIFRRGRKEADKPTKRRPMCRIPKRLLRHLRRWRRQDDILNAERLKAGQAPVETVLHHGGRAIRGRIRKGYKGIVADAGLDAAITPHWHRHTAATWLMEADVPIRRAAQYLGMTPRTLEKVYGHHRPDYQSDVSDAFDRGRRTRQ